MFYEAESFNEPLNNWNVSKVKCMAAMFRGAGFFNQPLDNWNVSNVTDMEAMFMAASSYQPLNNWNVSKEMQYFWVMHRDQTGLELTPKETP